MDEQKQILEFAIPELEPWRKQIDPGTQKKIEEIFEQARRHPDFLEIFKKEMKLEYIHDSNVASSVGTQTIGETAALLRQTKQSTDKTETTETETAEEMETLNMEKAFIKVEKLEKPWSTEKITEIHKTLLEGVSCTNGKLRSDLKAENEVQVKRPDGSVHHYPCHTLVKPMLIGVLAQHNIHMAKVPVSIEEKIPFLIKSAAWILTRFLTIHPFTDGNGRIARLLASHVLSEEVPFPVHAYKTGDIDRIHYLNAIIECQDDNSDPSKMSALLVDSVYSGYQKLEEYEEKWLSTRNYVLIPIQTNNKNEAWKKIKEVYEEATEKDEKKINQLFETPVTGDNTYKEQVLINTKRNVAYIVRVFKEQK